MQHNGSTRFITPDTYGKRKTDNEMLQQIATELKEEHQQQQDQVVEQQDQPYLYENYDGHSLYIKSVMVTKEQALKVIGVLTALVPFLQGDG